MHDIVCIRDRNGMALVGGVDHEIYRNYSPDKIPADFDPRREATFEWGYSGEGPREFSANILYAATNGDYAFAIKHHVGFVSEIIAPIPRSGGIIRSETIRAWIATRAEQNDGADST